MCDTLKLVSSITMRSCNYKFYCLGIYYPGEYDAIIDSVPLVSRTPWNSITKNWNKQKTEPHNLLMFVWYFQGHFYISWLLSRICCYRFSNNPNRIVEIMHAIVQPEYFACCDIRMHWRIEKTYVTVCRAVLYCAVLLCCDALYCVALYCVALYCVALCCTVRALLRCCAVLCYAMLCCVSCVVLCFAMLC